MYKLLIIEDENIIRSGLKMMIKKLNFNFDIYEAQDGTEALNITEYIKPDIVITDIKMPTMNGLDCIYHIKQIKNLHSPKFIILSGYSDFAYAQKAISLGVKEYLLKPIRKKDLNNILNKLIKILDIENKKQKHLSNALLKNIIFETQSAKDIESVINQSNLSLENGGFICAIIHINNNNKLLDSVNFKAIYQLNSLCLKYKDIYNNIILVFNINEDDINNFTNYLIKSIETCENKVLKEQAYIGMSSWVSNLKYLPLILKQSYYALDYRLFYWGTHIFYYNDYINNYSKCSLPIIYYNAIIDAISLQDKNEIISNTNKLFRFLINLKDINPEILKNAIDNILLTIQNYNICNKKNYRNTNANHLYQTSNSILQLKENLNTLLFKIIGSNTSKEKIYDDKAICMAINYIKQNYFKDLSLDIVANVVCMNYNYFSYLFKSSTGMSFVKYLQNYRIDQSKKLLKDPTNKIYEIAYKVGFNDEKYYYRVFKDITGVTPSEYRKSP